ncbi:MAG: diacylglycerol kinase family protein [Minisyncoccia bacterium]
MFQKFINSFGYAYRGIRTVFLEERNFKIEAFIALVVSIFAYAFDFSPIEILFCLVAITIVLLSEIINTAMEDLCTKVEPNHDHTIGKIKDIMAGFVLVSSVGALLIGVIVFYNHFL